MFEPMLARSVERREYFERPLDGCREVLECDSGTTLVCEDCGADLRGENRHLTVGPENVWSTSRFRTLGHFHHWACIECADYSFRS